MEFVTAIIGPLVQSVMVPIKKQLGYLVSSTHYVGEMGTRMTELNGKKVDIEKHMEKNKINNLEIPHRVPDWLKDVETIKAEAESIPIDVNGCFNVSIRYKAGRESSKILKKIDRLIREESEIKWTNHQKPLGKVYSKKASTTTPSRGSTQNDFESRDLIFDAALKSLQPDNQTHMIALCGMPGVGKTTMMEQLKKVVEDGKMFDWVLKAVIGQNTDPTDFQKAIADYMGEALTEKTKAARADRLHKRFGEMSKGGKKKILVILDDVWEMVDLKDIGLSPLPNQGVGFKLLLTSRDQDVCTQMGVETSSIFRVERLTDLEAESFFGQIAGLSHGSNPEVKKIGKDIVRRCGGLPIAIKIIASILKYKSKDEWKDALSRLKHHELEDNLREIFEMSYNNLKKDDHKAIFLLSGLFLDDFDIPVEDLMRYGWGLKLFTRVDTIAEARDRTNTCITKLINANLLLKSDHVGCVKIHDLLRDFVLSDFSKFKQALIVNHRNRSEWPTQDTSGSCERILLMCTGMSELPVDLKYPNLTLLKLMHGDKLLKFPKDFYERMEKLEVVAYERMFTPLLPETPQYSTKLRTLCLRSCSLMVDLSLLGNLTNLEILSFAHCSIRMLPSTIGKLRKLKLLDLTGCVDLRIDDGVFQNLVHLEELYMRVSDSKVVRFSDANCDELEMLSRKLFALVVEFFENKVQPKNVSFKNLERFMISVGCLLEDNEGSEGNNIDSFENTLQLVTNCNDLLKWKIDELFEKTEVLHLQVNDMNDLGDVFVHSPRPSLYNLRVLQISNCADLRYLFTVPVASGLTKLERLKISSCPIIEALVYIGNNGAQEIKFKELKFLSLVDLPNVTSIFPESKSTTSSMSSNSSAVVQPFFNNEVVIPKLEILKIGGMENLKKIWPCEITGSEKDNISTLRVIEVERCDSLVNLFPSNPLRILHHLEELVVNWCDSIEVLFNIDLECVHNSIEEESSRLRGITLIGLGKLREIWRMNGINNSAILVDGFQAVEIIYISECKSFRNVFTPTTTNFDLGALKDLRIEVKDPLEEIYDFSRDLIFNGALKSLQPDNPTQMIALCGMGGVGKTTMMEQLKKVVEDAKMFDWVLKVVIGQNTSPTDFQKAIADYMGEALTEITIAARVDRLHKRFEKMSEGGKKKILVILDDVWEMVDLKVIGLSPLPNQGAGFKFLLTSRNENVCKVMGVETSSIFRVEVLTDLEAENLFGQSAGLSHGSNPEVKEIGKDIVRRCGGLPIAIKIIASVLKGKSKDAWRDALSHLKHHDLDDLLHKIFEMSYNNLKKDDGKAIFILSGLFPDDFDIPREDLMRYGWGLKLFTKVHTLADARCRTNTCIDELISANLLIESDRIGCVKMHDLLHDFVLSDFSKVKQASIVNHHNRFEWPRQDTSESCERILLKCTDMCEFPRDFKYPNLTLLKLMDGDKLLKFPEHFYERMEKLDVVAYERMHTPLLPETLQYSTKLRTLCLRSCSLMDDLSLLGNLTNLEILSFADCSIRMLPSTIGKLRKLKLLDLTGCVALRIDDGVFQNLVHLEELYMRVSDSKVVRFTDSNCDELERLSSQLFALVLEFFKNKAQPKNVSFKKLERFMISMGCHLEKKRGNDIYSFKNTLKLVTNCNDLLECKINELFEKTEELYLQVNDMSYLEDVLLATRPSFCNLRVLDVHKCAELRYLFTVPVASGLTKLERLTISMCPVMEVLVYSENSGAQEIKFQKLKFLSLDDLPKLVSLCSFVNVIELPQLVELRLDGLPNVTSIFPESKPTTSSMSSNCSAVVQPFFNNEVVIPKLEILEIEEMEKLEKIWPCEITGSEKVNISTLRVIKVERCDSLVNLFPSNPLRMLHHLEEVEVNMCGSIEVLFNIDLECVHRIEEESSRLRKITVRESGKLREIWRMNG